MFYIDFRKSREDLVTPKKNWSAFKSFGWKETIICKGRFKLLIAY